MVTPIPNSPRQTGDLLAVLALLAAAFAGFGLRLGTLPYHGEETRRVQIAREMEASGDYLTPRLQGAPWPSKPPFFYWTLVFFIKISGSLDPWVLRLPSALATLSTALLLYAYTRGRYPPWGAFVVGFLFLTTGDILDSGNEAEIDPLFTLFTAAGLLFWHAGVQHRWSPLRYWVLASFFIALATLTKGLQAPVYFATGVGLYALVTRQFRLLWHPAALLGLAVYSAIVLAWAGPFAASQGMAGLKAVFVSESVSRSQGGWVPFGQHAAMFPLEWAGSLLPWSPLLLLFLSANFCRSLRERCPEAVFAACCVVVAFPTCWLPPGGEERYLRPILPSVMVLLGAAVVHLTQGENVPLWAGTVWRWFVRGWAAVLAGGAITLVLVSLLPTPEKLHRWKETTPIAVGFAMIALGTAGLLTQASSRPGADAVRRSVVLIGLMAGLCVTGLLVNRAIRRHNDAAGAVAELRRKLPPGHKLHSLGHVLHTFLLHYGDPVVLHPWPHREHDLASEVEYFCLDAFRGHHRPLPFAWEEVGRVCLDRIDRPIWDNVVIVGRRIRGSAAVSQR
jgi:4-amino-4-deoxy-L-arabinose transferase-like glycosyltransferase